jgi:hypothetical protein
MNYILSESNNCILRTKTAYLAYVRLVCRPADAHSRGLRDLIPPRVKPELKLLTRTCAHRTQPKRLRHNQHKTTKAVRIHMAPLKVLVDHIRVYAKL